MRAFFLHEGDLSLEVLLLLGGGDAAVGDVDPLARWICNGRVGTVGSNASSCEGFDIVEPVSAGRADGLDFFLGVPESESIGRDS